MDVRKKIGLRIKSIRAEKNISQKDLAYSSDIDRSYIASVENGNRNISIINIEKIAIALDVPLSDFFNSDIFNQ